MEYLASGFVRPPRTLLDGIESVTPASIEVHRCSGVRVTRYWDPATIPEAPCSAKDAIARGRSLIEQAVVRQLRADVPLGVFTSGGVDSSIIAAVATRQGARPLRLFTAGFEARSYDESRHAAAVAASLGAQHTTVFMDEAALREAFDTLTDRVAEPIADPAILPTYLLARRARQDVGVVLSGEGADELFGGYPTYVGHMLAPRFARLPRLVREGIRHLTDLLPASPHKVPTSWLLRAFVEAADLPWLERHTAWTGTDLPMAVLARGPDRPPRMEEPAGDTSPLRGAMLRDFADYLGCRLLPKLDRATMLVALEARAPYLDGDVTDFALGLPTDLKVRGLTTKWLLKRLAGEYLPPSIVHRRKRGLSVPVAAWLNHGLRDETDRLLSADRLRRQGLLSDVYVGRLVSEHRTGRANHARALWTLLVLQRWLERWLPEAA
jgi:asparagine synthase (glutamine-hydrolysing)